MKLTGNTILITGGGSGIGRGLAEALHKFGNQVIISGRRKGHLEEATKANPGMKGVELDVQDPARIKAVAARLIGEYPKLNVLINNAGVMHIDDVSVVVDEELLLTTITTNLMGPIRMTGAFIDHLKKQDRAVVINVSSVLGFCSHDHGGSVFDHKGGNAFLFVVASLQAKGHIREGIGDRASVGRDGPLEQQGQS
jgi:uncharacterized oxidoreductase